MIPEQIKTLVSVLTKLPSLGPRQAIRLAFHLTKWSKDDMVKFGESLLALSSIKTCPSCFFIHQSDSSLCDICSNPNRRKDIIIIVEKPTDLISLEQTKKINARYFIIGDLKRTGVLDAEQRQKIQLLKDRIEKECGGRAEEIILAMNPTTYGDINANLLSKELANHARKISRLGRGIPTGGEIEFADEDTLGSAFDNRQSSI